MDPENPSTLKGTSSNLSSIVFSSALVGLIIGAGVYAFQESSFKETREDLEQKIASLENQVAQTNTLKTYADQDYSLSFDYPSRLGLPQATSIQPESEGPWWDFKQNSIVFGDYSVVVSATTLDSIRMSENASGELKKDVDSLVTVFKNRKSNLTTPLWLPPSNASIQYHTTPQYIENSDGSFRGVYYYAFIGQELPEEVNGSVKMGDIVAVVSDGTGRIFQVHARLYPDYGSADSYEYENVSCMDNESKTAKCVVNKQVTADFSSTYKKMIESLKSL